MISNNQLMLRLVQVVVMVFSISQISLAQPSADLARLQVKYPGKFVITESATLDIAFELTKTGEPELSFTENSSLFVLADNSTVLSESKEYFNSKLEVKELEAYSLVPNQNSYKKYPVSTFTKTHETGDGVFYDDMYAYIFNFPMVGKGTRLVTSSKTVCSDPFYPISFFFGNQIPVENAVITLTLPENVDIIYHLFGYDTTEIRFSKTRKGKFTTYKWSSSPSRSYISDKDSPSSRYFTPHIIINIAGYSYKGKYTRVLGNLKDLYAWDYAKISNLNSPPSPEIKQLADSICSGGPTDHEKVRKIFRWVQQNIKYVAIEDGDNGFVPREASLVLQRRYGDCKDKSSILNAMLRSVGLKSDLAWIGTRSLPYKYSEFPAMANSNHMIAIWWDENNKPLPLDGTTLFHSLHDIPASIQGKQCIIAKGPDDFVLYEIPVSLPEDNISIDSVWMSFENGLLKGNGVASFTGELKTDLLASFEGVDSTKYKNLLNRLIPMASNKFTYTAAAVSDLQKLDQPLTVAYNFELPDYITSNNGSIYVNLNIERYLSDIQLKADRWIPVDIETPFIHRFISVLKIPENTVVGNLPETSSYSNSKFSFNQEYTRTGNSILLSTEIMANFQLLTSVDEIKQFREMLGLLNKSFVKSIVLTKK
jgi:hypothetical protein